MTNTGTADATLTAVTAASLGLSDPYSVTGGTCVTSTTVTAGGGSCTIIVQFTPTTTAQINETVDVQYSGGALATSADAVRGVSGQGILDCVNYPQPQCPPPAPSLAFTDTTANSYGNVAIGASSTLTFTMTNTGQADATLGSITDGAIGLAAPLSISGGTCGTGSVLTAGGGSCTLSIQFSPGDTSTTTETISIAYSGEKAAMQIH